jgi:hypothetical protein
LRMCLSFDSMFGIVNPDMSNTFVDEPITADDVCWPTKGFEF